MSDGVTMCGLQSPHLIVTPLDPQNPVIKCLTSFQIILVFYECFINSAL